jgi:hypothetical protein
MKIVFTAISMLVIVLASCNNKSPKEPTLKDTPHEDTSAATLEDLSTSTDIKKLLCQNWENKEDAEDAAASGGGGSLEMLYRGFSFFTDGSVTQNPRDEIQSGKWELNDADKLIKIKYANGKTAQYKIGAIGAKKMLLLNMADNKKTDYIADAKMQLAPAEDPFYPANNEWRLKPKRSESDSAIKLRTEQCILFYARFLKDNGQRGGNSISFVGLPACFKWYRGGVSVVGKEKLEQKWINCYYNKAQALKAHTMLENIISKKYKWNKEETNWVKQSADVVMQMYTKFKSTSVEQLLK